MSNYQKSLVTMTAQTKKMQLIAKLALAIAKKKNPNEYAKYKALRLKYLMAKKALIHKNLGAATTAARQYLVNKK